MKYTYLIGAAIVSCGLVGFGCLTSNKFLGGRELVEVKGLSEKVVRADIGDALITTTANHEVLEELYKKRMADGAKVIEFLRACGVTNDEIVGSSINTTECEDDVTSTSEGITVKNKKKYYKAEDVINVRTKDLEKIEKIKSRLVNLGASGILVKCDYSYKLTSFLNVKMEMMKEASENARKSADAAVAPHGKKIKDVVYLRQGEISIRAEGEKEDVDYWNSKESTSINKRLRLVVNAGFSKSGGCGISCE
ncbi:hypothetical protein FACS1894122_02010 [Alphaproteobacteria bacterium]|nr:hypothetical protein FACS1894122_02010 [Alphaproteobacteria bacterium]